MKKAVVLLSGGLDSGTALYVARSEHFECIAISFDYGQKHRVELEKAQLLSRAAGVLEHLEIRLDRRLFSGSALVDPDLSVPVHRPIDGSIPITYVPGRNILFLAHALSLAESRSASHIFIGANVLDYSGYPDCRPEFLSSFQEMARLGSKVGQDGQAIQIQAPLISLTKTEIIRLGLRLGVDYALTSSCYQPDSSGFPCQQCDSCVLRQKGFEGAGLTDPLLANERAH